MKAEHTGRAIDWANFKRFWNKVNNKKKHAKGIFLQ